MDNQLFELKDSFKQLTQNLMARIDAICEQLNDNETQNLQYWLEDLTVFTEGAIILSENNIIDFEIDVFNEKFELLLDKVEEKDYLFVADILQFEIKPLLTYWDGCLTND